MSNKRYWVDSLKGINGPFGTLKEATEFLMKNGFVKEDPECPWFWKNDQGFKASIFEDLDNGLL